MVDLPAPDKSTVSRPGGRQLALRPKVVDLNLIPFEFRRPLVTGTRLFLVTVIVSASIVLPRLQASQIRVSSQAADLRERLADVIAVREAETRRIASQKAEETRLDQELNALREQVAQTTARAIVSTQTQRRINLAEGLELLLSGETGELQILAVTWQEPNLTVEGKARTLPALMAYTDKMQKSGKFRELRLGLLEEKTEADVAVDNGKTQGSTRPVGSPTIAPIASIPVDQRWLGFVLQIEVPVDGLS